MRFQIIAPPAALKNYVQHYWILEYCAAEDTRKTFTVMSNGIPGLIFQENPSIFTGFQGERLPQLFVFGQARKAGQLHGSGSFRTMGVNLQPAALKSVFGFDSMELTDQHACISLLHKNHLPEQLMYCHSIRERLYCLSAYLLAQVQRHDSGNPKVEYAVAALQRGADIAQVLQHLHLSERSLERLFQAHVGITPMLYARICRFQRSLALMREGRCKSLTDVAHTSGYYDQSHFIRDFKLFSGASPGNYLRNATEPMPGFPEWQS